MRRPIEEHRFQPVIVCARRPRPTRSAPRRRRPAVQLEPCDACGLIGELVDVKVPNPIAGVDLEPQSFTVRVHAKTCQKPDAIKRAVERIRGVRHE